MKPLGPYLGKLDPWLVEQAENAGAQCITGIRVDKLVERDGKVVGVKLMVMYLKLKWSF